MYHRQSTNLRCNIGQPHAWNTRRRSRCTTVNHCMYHRHSTNLRCNIGQSSTAMDSTYCQRTVQEPGPGSASRMRLRLRSGAPTHRCSDAQMPNRQWDTWTCGSRGIAHDHWRTRMPPANNQRTGVSTRFPSRRRKRGTHNSTSKCTTHRTHQTSTPCTSPDPPRSTGKGHRGTMHTQSRHQNRNRNHPAGDRLGFSPSLEAGTWWPHSKKSRHPPGSREEGGADPGPTRGNWGRSSPTSPPFHPLTNEIPRHLMCWYVHTNA